jgi:hypothetical protein
MEHMGEMARIVLMIPIVAQTQHVKMIIVPVFPVILTYLPLQRLWQMDA